MQYVSPLSLSAETGRLPVTSRNMTRAVTAFGLPLGFSLCLSLCISFLPLWPSRLISLGLFICLMLKTWERYLISDATALSRQTAARVSLKMHVTTQMCTSVSVPRACYRIRMGCFFFFSFSETLSVCLSVQSKMGKKKETRQLSMELKAL